MSATHSVSKILLLLFVASFAANSAAQIPDRFTNLEIFAEDIARDELIGHMRDFSMALGVRCEHCHYSPTGSFRDMEWSSDLNPNKDKARTMIRMLETINYDLLTKVKKRGDPPVEVRCKTCHRGRARPFLLEQELLMAAHQSGADSAATLYRSYRDEYYGRGTFDFGVQETSEAADELAEEGRPDDAIVLYELNADFHPETPEIWSSLGRLYEAVGRTDDAIAAWERVLDLQPNARQAQERLDALRGK